MTPIGWPSQTQQNNFLNLTLEAIGRNISIYHKVSVSGCPVCSLEPVSNTSTNAFCPVCSGSYWLENLAEYPVLAHVTWGGSEGVAWYSAGQQVTGKCSIRLNYNSEVKTVIDNARYLVVDDRTMQIEKVNLRGSPEINRILISLKEAEE